MSSQMTFSGFGAGKSWLKKTHRHTQRQIITAETHYAFMNMQHLVLRGCETQWRGQITVGTSTIHRFFSLQLLSRG